MVQNSLAAFERKTCAMCGAQAGDFWQTERTRVVTLRACPRHSDWPRVWLLCDECEQGLNCNEGLQNTAMPKPDQVWLLSQIRRAKIDDQLAVLAWLTGKFGKKLTD